jgi:hypothetical protein
MGTIVAGSLLLGACATGISGPVVTADDSCSTYRQPIADVKRSGLQPEDVLLAVGVGTAAGVITGLTTRNKGAGLAAAIGGLTLTGGARYLQRQQQAHQNQQQLAAAIYQDEVRDGNTFTPVRAAVVQLRGCRRQQFDALLSDVRSGRATREQARGRFDTLLAQRHRDDEIVSAALDAAGQRVGLYQEAVQKSQSDQIYSAFAAQTKPLPPVSTRRPANVRAATIASPPPVQAPLRTLVDDVKHNEVTEKGQTDTTVDSLRVLLG